MEFFELTKTRMEQHRLKKLYNVMKVSLIKDGTWEVFKKNTMLAHHWCTYDDFDRLYIEIYRKVIERGYPKVISKVDLGTLLYNDLVCFPFCYSKERFNFWHDRFSQLRNKLIDSAGRIILREDYGRAPMFI